MNNRLQLFMELLLTLTKQKKYKETIYSSRATKLLRTICIEDLSRFHVKNIFRDRKLPHEIICIRLCSLKVS